MTVRLAPLPLKTMLAVGTSVVFDEPAETVRFATGVSASPTVNAIAPVETPVVTARLAMLLIVGAVFAPTVFTVNKNVSVAVNVPSLTVTVMVALPT